MASPYCTVKDAFIESLRGAFSELGYSTNGIELSVTPSEKFGDMSCSFALRAAKEKRKNPSEVAVLVAANINKMYGGQGWEAFVTGAYINLRLERSSFSKEAVNYALRLRRGTPISDAGRGKKAIVEYPSANPAHPLHVGQVRSALLGDCIANLYAACGFVVEREDYIDDLGLQAAYALWGSINRKMLGLPDTPEKRFDHALGDAYVAGYQYISSHKEAEGEIRALTKLIETEGTKEAALSRRQAEQYVKAEHDTLFDYGIYHDVLIWESDVIRADLLNRSLAILDKHKLLDRPKDGKYAGCTIINLSKLGNLPQEFRGLREDAKVLIRSNGAPNYLAKDIAFHMWKFGLLDNLFKYSEFEIQPDKKVLYTTGKEGSMMPFGGADVIINTIDARQAFEQTMIKVVFEALGEKSAAEGFNHLAYGVVELESGALAGRKGTWMGFTAQDLVDEAREKAMSLIGERFKMGSVEKGEVAGKIAVGAVKYEFLKQSPEKIITFSWARALNFEGNSGPYCQYMYARAKRLLGDSGFGPDKIAMFDSKALVGDYEFALIRLISMLEYNVEKARTELRPNVLIEYANQLSGAFSVFYENSPVLKANSPEEKLARLALTASFANSIMAVLALLGIPVTEKM